MIINSTQWERKKLTVNYKFDIELCLNDYCLN